MSFLMTPDSVNMSPRTGPCIVETSTVTDESLEAILNEWVAHGWTFEGMQFAMRESSKRPAMAFVLFTRREGAAQEAAGT